jgi:hypothetical protein
MWRDFLVERLAAGDFFDVAENGDLRAAFYRRFDDKIVHSARSPCSLGCSSQRGQVAWCATDPVLFWPRREVVALSGSRKTESLWVRTTVYSAATGERVATMLLKGASIKGSRANYKADYASLYTKG